MAQRRLVVADDNPQSLETLVSFLQAEFEIVATATDGKSVLESVHQTQPDVVVLAFNKPAGGEIEIVRELAKDPQGPAVVICSVDTRSDVVEAALQAGATAYVSKAQLGESLVLAVQSARRGLSFTAGKGKRGSAAARAKFFKELGRRVRELRIKAGYTQATMVKFGFSVRHWQQIEAGRPTTLTTMLRICEVFKIKLEDLLRGLE